MAENLAPIRAQGREAKRLNDDEGGTFSEHSCPYGPGANRDAWLAGFGGAAEEIRQVDTSTPNTDDVREETPKVVKEGSKGKGSAKSKTEAAKNATAVTTDVTGTGETALVTRVEPANPELTDTVPNPETIIGDPAASTSPAEVQHVDDATGDSVKSSDVM